jgi:hypothetical protein
LEEKKDYRGKCFEFLKIKKYEREREREREATGFDGFNPLNYKGF